MRDDWRPRGMDWPRGDWPPYVPMALRRQRAEGTLARLVSRGQSPAPVVIEGRAIARTFWGKAWCDNLERYSDFANRLPRGRAYVRNGSVIHLDIGPGAVTALVSGSDVYRVTVTVRPVPPARWRAICRDCTGAIDSLVELLQGRLSRAVMERLCRQETGLFPSPAEIALDCSCPDRAAMCKHVAAVLYGVGARLDEKPALLFALRRANEADLIARAGHGMTRTATPTARGKILDAANLSDIFGLDLAEIPEPRGARARSSRRAASRARPRKRRD